MNCEIYEEFLRLGVPVKGEDADLEAPVPGDAVDPGILLEQAAMA